jgi:uncharacterized membrane protein YbhN (UPF0104 family)
VIQKIENMTSRNKKVFFAIKITVSILILYFLIQKISFAEILIAAQTAQFGYILLALLLLPANLLCQYKRWAYLVRFESQSASRTEILSSILAGITLGLATPGRLGEFGRFLFIREAQWPRMFGFLFLEKIYTMCALYVVGILGLWFYFMDNLSINLKWIYGLLFFPIILLLLFLVFNPSPLRGLFEFVERRWGQKKRLSLFVSINKEISKKTARILFSNSFFQILIYLTQFVLLTRAFSPLKILDGYFAAACTMITKAFLPIAFGDLGVRETAAVFYFKGIGVSSVSAFNASILLFVINLLLPGIVGLFLILKFRMADTSLIRGDES